MKNIVLASTSKPRAALLNRLLLEYQIANPSVDETPLVGESPTALVKRLAEMKARAVSANFPNSLIIGADQVGVLDNQILCKPHTYENAVKQLQNSSGKCVEFLIGLCLLDTQTGKSEVVLEKFSVIFRQLTETMIKNYLQKEQPYQCAGSCDGDGFGIVLIEKFIGDDYTALIGLPLIRLVQMLEKYIQII